MPPLRQPHRRRCRRLPAACLTLPNGRPSAKAAPSARTATPASLSFSARPAPPEVRLRGRRVDEDGFMHALLDECRRNLEETLDYLADYWREDLDIDPDEMEKRLEEVDPDLFEEENNWRSYLEEQYLKIHAWFRERRMPIPNPGWRSEYVEDVVALGYPTLLGE